jgi:hypothetical protein
VKISGKRSQYNGFVLELAFQLKEQGSKDDLGGRIGGTADKWKKKLGDGVEVSHIGFSLSFSQSYS